MKVLKLILVCWFLALFPSVPYLLDHTLDICAQNCTACWIPVDNVKYYLLEVIGGIFDLNLLFQPPIVIWHSFCHTTPLLLIFGAWLQITRVLKSSKKDCKPANKRIQTSHKYNIQIYNSKLKFVFRRIMIIIGILTFCFISCNLPLTYCLISSLFVRPKDTMWMDIGFHTVFLNSIFNPLITIFFMIRTDVRKLFCSCIQLQDTAQLQIPIQLYNKWQLIIYLEV